jgi:hypothetical protein
MEQKDRKAAYLDFSSIDDGVHQLVISPKIASKRMIEIATTTQYARSQEHATQHRLENAQLKKRW